MIVHTLKFINYINTVNLYYIIDNKVGHKNFLFFILSKLWFIDKQKDIKFIFKNRIYLE